MKICIFCINLKYVIQGGYALAMVTEQAMQPISTRQAGITNDFVRGQTEVTLPLETTGIPILGLQGKDDD